MKYLIKIIFLFCACNLQAQKQDYTWTFANGGGLVFSDTGVVSQFHSSVGGYCEVNCSSVSDTAGNLLCYAGATGIGANVLQVFDRYGSLMLNGDSLYGNFSYLNGSNLIERFDSSQPIHLFSLDHLNPNFNLRYSKIDLNANGGLGSVILKDSLVDNVNSIQKVCIIQHGNGRDWWIIIHRAYSANNGELVKYLLTPNGLNFSDTQNIGSGPLYVNYGPILYNAPLSQIVSVGVYGYIDIFDFDRCTGQLSNFAGFIDGDGSGTQLEHIYQGAAISPSGQYLYVTPSHWTQKYVYQFDLLAANVLASKNTVYHYPDTGLYAGLSLAIHKTGPDGRIYMSKGEGYPVYRNDTMTQSIDVILYPDSQGVACAYSPNHLKLDSGAFTVYGFPNMPDYRVGPDVGSICDTLPLKVSTTTTKELVIEIFPNPSFGIFNFALKNKNDAINEIIVYNSVGKKIVTTTYSSIDLSKQHAGLYYYRCSTINKKVYKGKIVKE